MSGLKGKLTITVIEVKDLKDTELIGKMDPYVKLECGKEHHKTKTMKHAGRNATFNQTFIFNLEGKEDSLHIHVMDEELISDDHVGRVDIPLQKAASITDKFWYQLVDRNDFHKMTGQVCVQVSFVGTGLAHAAAAPAKEEHHHAHHAAAAPVVVQQQQMQQQPQVVYAQQPQPQMMMMGQQQPQMVYAQQPQVQMVRGTDGKLYAIQQPVQQQQPQVVYVQAPMGAMQAQPPRYM